MQRKLKKEVRDEYADKNFIVNPRTIEDFSYNHLVQQAREEKYPFWEMLKIVSAPFLATLFVHIIYIIGEYG